MYIYLYVDVAMSLMALVEILRITLLIIEKCKRHQFTQTQRITSVFTLVKFRGSTVSSSLSV